MILSFLSAIVSPQFILHMLILNLLFLVKISQFESSVRDLYADWILWRHNIVVQIFIHVSLTQYLLIASLLILLQTLEEKRFLHNAKYHSQQCFEGLICYKMCIRNVLSESKEQLYFYNKDQISTFPWKTAVDWCFIFHVCGWTAMSDRPRDSLSKNTWANGICHVLWKPKPLEKILGS